MEGADGQQSYSETSTPFLCSPPPNVLSDILSEPTTVGYLKKSNWLLPDVVVETVRGCGQPTPRQPVLVWRRFFPALRPQPSPPSFYLPRQPSSRGGPATRVPAMLYHISIYCHAFYSSRPIFDQLFRKLPILLMIRL